MTETTKAKDQGALEYMVQLDGLRAIAVLLVLVEHFVPVDASRLRALPFGTMGVDLFFVLSGFLVSAILLRCKATIDSGQQSTAFTLGRFYMRRLLRIFPVYYLVVFAAAIFAIEPYRDTFWWLVSYTYNIFRAIAPGTGAEGYAVHMWSLAQEEQFYMIWPLLLFLTPRRHLLKVMIGVVALAPLSRVALVLGGFGAETANVAIRFFPFANLELFAMGAILAWIGEAEPIPGPMRRRFLRICGVLGVAALVGVGGLFATGVVGKEVLRVSLQSVHALLFTPLIAAVAVGLKGPAGKFLSLAPMVYLGRISYGIYLYHLLVMGALPVIAAAVGAPLPEHWAPRAALYTLVTVAISAASWRLFEEPINRYKRHFGYRRSAGAQPGAGQ